MKHLSHLARATCCISAVVLAAYAPETAHAGAIPYPNPGTVNPMVYTFTAMNTGDIDAYFVGRGGAAYSEDLGMLVNGVPTGIEGLNNHTSNAGDMIDLGHVTAGQTVTFYIDVWTGSTFGTGTHLGDVYSNPSLNGAYDSTYFPSPGVNHVYSTFYNSTSGILPASIPTGVYVGFEDLPASNPPDYNYADEQYVFTDVGMTGTVPDSGSSVTLLGLGLAGVGLLGLRGCRKQTA